MITYRQIKVNHKRLLVILALVLLTWLAFGLGRATRQGLNDPKVDHQNLPSRGASVPLPGGYSYPHQDVGGAEEYRRFDAR